MSALEKKTKSKVSTKPDRETREDIQSVIEKNPDKKWYIIQTAANCENAAKKNIFIQLDVKGRRESVAHILIPEHRVVEIKNGEKKISDKKLYPGYVFILADIDEEVWHCINSANKVSRFVNERTGCLPQPIPKTEVFSIVNSLDSVDTKPKQKVIYNENDTVRINGGPFEGFNGVINSVNYNKSLLNVKVSIFGRDTPVDLKFSEVDLVKE